MAKQTDNSLALVTRTKPNCFHTVFQCLISVSFQLLISNNWNPTEIALEKTFVQPLKNSTFQTENQPFWNVGNTYFNGCCVTRVGSICVCALLAIIVKFGAKMIGIISPRYLSVYLSSGAYADNLVDEVDQLLLLYQKKSWIIRLHRVLTWEYTQPVFNWGSALPQKSKSRVASILLIL